MSSYIDPAPWFKHYRRRLPSVFRKLGRVATDVQIARELESQGIEGVKLSSVRHYCEACCVNGTGRHNLFGTRVYDPKNHFLLKVAPRVYAFPNPKYLDMAAVFRLKHGPKSSKT